MKQTAVEWLFDNLNITGGSEDMKAFEQAKQMEKEQMIDVYNEVWNNILGQFKVGEIYYNETYEK